MERVDDNLDYIRLANLTDGFSGSDLREICRTASVYRMRELMSSLHDEENSGQELRPLTNDDLLKSVAKLRESRFVIFYIIVSNEPLVFVTHNL